MVHKPGRHFVTERIGHPGKKFGKPPTRGRGVQAKAREDLDQRQEEQHQIGKRSHVVVTHAVILQDLFLFVLKKHIHFQDVLDVLPGLSGHRYKGPPIGIVIAVKSPVYPGHGIDKENIGRNKMDHSHGAEPIGFRGFRSRHQCRWIRDQESRDGQNRYADHIQPVKYPDRQFPDKYPFKLICLLQSVHDF